MRSLDLPEVEQCFARLNHRGCTSWKDDLDAGCRRKQRQRLVDNQASNCGWCEREISNDNSHIDHLRTRDSAPSEIFDHRNIVASCGKNRGEYCGHARPNSNLPDRIDPYRNSELQSDLRVEIDGRPVPESRHLPPGDVEAIESAVNYDLNLNHKVLCQERARRLAEIILYTTKHQRLTREEIEGFYTDFPSILEQVFRRSDK